MKFLTGFILLVVVGILGSVVLVKDISKSEVVECLKWKQQSEEYSHFFLVQWQDEQCKAHGIVINTLIK